MNELLKAPYTSGFVYFIRRGRTVKIGYAHDPISRMRHLQTANSHALILLGAIGGSYQDEKAIRLELREHRLRGEWVSANRSVMAYIKTILAERGIPYDWLAAIHANPDCQPPPMNYHRTGEGDDSVRRCLETTQKLRTRIRATSNPIVRRRPPLPGSRGVP